jgi:hypothetical protein
VSAGCVAAGTAPVGGVDDTGRSVAGELTSPTCPGAAVDPGLAPDEVVDRWTGTVNGVIAGAAGAGTVASGAGDASPVLPTKVSPAPSVAAWPASVSSAAESLESPESGRPAGSGVGDSAERATTRGAGVWGAAGTLGAGPVTSELPVSMKLVPAVPA